VNAATLHDGMRRRFIGRLRDAQDKAGHGRLLWVAFLPRGKKVTAVKKPIAKTLPGSLKEAEDFVQQSVPDE
jgi:hypothetical protein